VAVLVAFSRRRRRARESEKQEEKERKGEKGQADGMEFSNQLGIWL